MGTNSKKNVGLCCQASQAVPEEGGGREARSWDNIGAFRSLRSKPTAEILPIPARRHSGCLISDAGRQRKARPKNIFIHTQPGGRWVCGVLSKSELQPAPGSSLQRVHIHYTPPPQIPPTRLEIQASKPPTLLLLLLISSHQSLPPFIQ